MLELFSADTSIVVGLSLTEHDEHVLQSAVSLAQRTGSQLILTHATHPYQNYSLAREGFALPYEEFEKDAYDQDLADAQNRLEIIRDSLPSSLVSEIRVLRDYPEDALEEVALSCKATLIICGWPKAHPAKILRGMSTALSLMAHSRFPVMVIPGGTTIDFQDHPLTVLVADDLKVDGRQALRGALGFCRSIDLEQMVHAYVNPMSYREINTMVEKIQVAMLEGSIPSDPAFNSQLYISQTKEELKQVLKQRIESMDPGFTHEYKYRPSVRFGPIDEELHRLTKETKCRILMFGKHHMVHRGRFQLGRIPYEAMVESQMATIVVPDPVPSREAGTE